MRAMGQGWRKVDGGCSARSINAFQRTNEVLRVHGVFSHKMSLRLRTVWFPPLTYSVNFCPKHAGQSSLSIHPSVLCQRFDPSVLSTIRLSTTMRCDCNLLSDAWKRQTHRDLWILQSLIAHLLQIRRCKIKTLKQVLSCLWIMFSADSYEQQ